MSDSTRRVAELLDQVQRGDQKRFDLFCEALSASGQEHIVNDYLKNSVRTCSGDVSDDVPDAIDKPLSPKNLKLLTSNWNELVDCVESGEVLMSEMETRRVCSELQIRKLKVC
jgi:hypothetical protein